MGRTHKEITYMSNVEQWAVCPCKDCEERHLGCQGSCEKYKAYKEQIKKNKEAYHRANHHILYWAN